MLEQNFGVRASREGTHVYLWRLAPQRH